MRGTGPFYKGVWWSATEVLSRIHGREILVTMQVKHKWQVITDSPHKSHIYGGDERTLDCGAELWGLAMVSILYLTFENAFQRSPCKSGCQCLVHVVLDETARAGMDALKL